MQLLEQRINFFQDVFRKPQIRFPFRQMLSVWAVVLALLLLVTAVDYARTLSQRSQLALLQSGHERMQAAVTQLNDQLAARVVDKALEQKENGLRETLVGKQQFLVALKQQGDTHQMHFSGVLNGLEQIENKALWLTRIRVQAPGPQLSLTGLTSEARAVPDYLAALNSEAVFAGLPFRTLNLERLTERSRYLTFTVSTQHDAKTER